MKSILNMINSKKDDIPIVVLKENIFFPEMTSWITFDNELIINSITESMLNGRVILLAYLNDSVMPKKEDLKNLYPVGVYSKVIQVVKLEKDVMKVLFECQERVLIDSVINKNSYLRAKVTFISDDDFDSDIFNYVRFLKESYEIYKTYIPIKTFNDVDIEDNFLNSFESPNRIVDIVASNVNLDRSIKIDILQELNTKARLEKLIINLNAEINLLELKRDISSQVKSKLDKGQRDYFLNEQIKEIQKRLGKDETDYFERLNKKNIPNDIKIKIEKEISKLSRAQFNSSDVNIIRSYIDLILDLPWNQESLMKNSLDQIEITLRNSHYGMDEAKEKIINFLAVYQINTKVKAPIICLVGPPGTGKTSLAEAVANSISRKFVKISLGGIRDEAEIRGHRRTYIGALPGVFINAIKRAGISNPVILLDEIDKINNSYKGNPEAALLEVLDPDQNYKFVDHYLDIPYDLSSVLFIATANSIQEMSKPLLDRMEIIRIEGYSYIEKLEIAKFFSIPAIIKESALDKIYIKIEDDVILNIIKNYTMESGVRELKRILVNLVRRILRELLYKYPKELIVNGNFYYPNSLMHKNNSIFTHDPDIEGIYKIININNFINYVDGENNLDLIKIDSSGFVYGLAFTSYGGAVLPVEAIKFNKKGDIILTGSLGDVMKESAKLAYSVVKSYYSKLKLNTDEIPEIHLHFPEGSTPKDGPSAGITIATAIASILSDKKIPLDLAMTGEVTLKGSILPVGGIKEKVLAAYRNGINKIILPKNNKKDYTKLPDEVRENMDVKFVSSLDEVFDYLNII